jgi:hypothetical protein
VAFQIRYGLDLGEVLRTRSLRRFGLLARHLYETAAAAAGPTSTPRRAGEQPLFGADGRPRSDLADVITYRSS